MAWNGSAGETKPQRKTAAKRSKIWPIVAVGVSLAALGVVAVLLIQSDSTTKNKPKPLPEVKESPKKEQKTTAKPAKVILEEPPKRVTKKGTPIPDNVKPDERGIMRYPNGQRWVDKNDLHIVKHPQKRKLFKRTCDNQIALMLTLDPSKMAPFLIGKRRPYGDRFLKDFHESLYDTYEPDPEDTPEEAEIRKMVMETRTELKAAMDKGENIADIMNKTQEELDRLCQYQNDLKKELNEIQYDESVSDDDFKDFVTAANEMLKKQGMPGITMPNIITRQARIKKMQELQLRKEQEAKQ